MKKTFVTSILMWLPLIGAATSLYAFDSGKIYVYAKGKPQQIEAGNPCFNSITDNALKLFSSANSGYRLIVTQDLIDSLKSKEGGVEIFFNPPKKIEVKKQNKMFSVSKIFIPLSGDFFKNHTTLFFGTPEYDPDNQCTNSVDLDARSKILECASKFAK